MKEPDYYTLLETNISQFCIICSEKIKKLLVYCQGTIGHLVLKNGIKFIKNVLDVIMNI